MLGPSNGRQHHSGVRQRIVFMGSPAFAIPTLDRLVKTHDVCAVYSQPAKKSGRGMKTKDVPVAAYANALNLPLFTPTHLKSTDIEAQLAGHEADLFVVVAYGLILPRSILEIPRLGCLNGHASLLPRWRGAAPIQRAIEAGDTETGISAMLMEAGLDTGPVVCSQRTPISKSDTAGSLHDRLATLTATCLGEVIDGAPTSLAAPIPQPDDGVIYAAKITSDDAMIDWQQPASILDCHIRAFTPYPGAWCGGPKGRLRILEAHPVPRPAEHMAADAGIFLGKDSGSKHCESNMMIACSEGALAITRVQPAGKKPMLAVDFLNGAGLKIGDHLQSETGISNL
ncbi:MAG: methionyl-tRNA formyltransferase [Candidatus Puniceispirillum sp.]|nr:methionyl-tRNA formyltransferase [Candidatus Puniceispirillum sp.]MBL6775266.1 methionyl-tRNA formyltransferase [Candidatus Puniceispirillum sp.]